VLISVVTPSYNEAKNLPVLYEALQDVFAELDVQWEWVVIDDHSKDGSFEVFQDLARCDARLRGFRFSRNYGSHKALTCGMREARGDCCIVLAADMQDPPSTIPELLAHWKEGSQIVWAVRAERKGQGKIGLGFSHFYYWLMRNVVGLKSMPATGADFFLVDRLVLEAFRQFNESNVSILALMSSMGFRQSEINYTKEARLHGSSGWTLGKKLKLVADSVTSFSYFPIRAMSYLGFLVGTLGFLYAGWIIYNYVIGEPVMGWSSIMVVVLLLGGTQMMMLGVLGEYVWRALDESRARPLYLIEGVVVGQAQPERIEEVLREAVASR